MKTYVVFATVVGGFSTRIEAASKDEAIEKFNNEYSGGQVSICHQCAHEIDEPTIGDADEVIEIE